MRLTSHVAVLFVAGLITSGCASSSHGTKLDTAKVEQIKRGVTTRAEVEQALGAPMNTSMMGDGKRMMYYQYSETDAKVKGTTFIPIVGSFMGGTTATTRTQQLQIVLNKDGIVEDYEMNDGTSNQDYSQGFGRSSMSSTPVATKDAK